MEEEEIWAPNAISEIKYKVRDGNTAQGTNMDVVQA